MIKIVKLQSGIPHMYCDKDFKVYLKVYVLQVTKIARLQIVEPDLKIYQLLHMCTKFFLSIKY